MSDSAFDILLALLGGLGGLILILLAGRVRRFNEAAQRWPTTEATVETIKIIKSYHRPGFHVYYPLITYRFTVNNQPYSGAASDRTHANRERIVQFVNQHPPGAKIQIRYNPNKPEENLILVDQSTPGQIEGAGWGCIITALFLIFIV